MRLWEITITITIMKMAMVLLTSSPDPSFDLSLAPDFRNVPVWLMPQLRVGYH